jgi:protein gp37
MPSAIEWTEETWNPTTGCDRCSPGCSRCYALTLAARLKAMGQAKYQHDGDPRTSGPGFGLTVHPDALETPLRWRRPRFVFVNSMSDLFHPGVPDDFIGNVFDVMMRAEQHTFQILTKRPQRMKSFVDLWLGESWAQWIPNLWLGTSVESDPYAFRVEHLVHTPAAVRFVSYEPALGPLPSLDVDAGVAFFFKQVGGRTPKAGGRELDGRTWDEMPLTAVGVGGAP